MNRESKKSIKGMLVFSENFVWFFFNENWNSLSCDKTQVFLADWLENRIYVNDKIYHNGKRIDKCKKDL